MSTTDTRVAFEAAMNNARFFPRELDFTRTKSPSGRDEYANSHLQSEWLGWQAALAWQAALSLSSSAVQESAQAELPIKPIGYIRQSELDKMADARVIGVGLMLHKEPGDGKIAVYAAPASTQPV